MGGSIVGLLNIARNLDKTKYTPIIVCIHEGTHCSVIKKDFPDLIVLDRPKLRHGNILQKFLLRAYHLSDLLKTIKREQVSLIHFNNIFYYPGVFASILTKTPCISHLRSLPVDYHTQMSKITLMTKIFSNFVNEYIAVSTAVLQGHKKLGIKLKNSGVVYNGVDIEGIKEKASEPVDIPNIDLENDIVLGTVARLSWEKGLKYLFSALPEIIKKHARLKCLIVGDGPLREELTNQVQDLGLTEKVIFTGETTNPFKYSIKFNIFIVPSEKEGLSRSILEAMALTKPIIATKVGGIPELIEHKKDGFLIEPKSSEEIIRAVNKIISDDELRTTIKNNAYKKVLNNFAIKQCIQKIEKIYDNYL